MTTFYAAADNATLIQALKDAGILDEDGNPTVRHFKHCCNAVGCGRNEITTQEVLDENGDVVTPAVVTELTGCHVMVKGHSEDQATAMSAYENAGTTPNMVFR